MSTWALIYLVFIKGYGLYEGEIEGIRSKAHCERIGKALQAGMANDHDVSYSCVKARPIIYFNNEGKKQ